MNPNSPLAFRVRPQDLDNFLGQEHLVAKGKPLRIILESGAFPSSIIFWGPPGCGKTTLARLISKFINAEFISLSAVSAKKEDVQNAINKAKLFQRKTILFLDEIHRFNKAQQDFLLPFVESGLITLIGATTENPSFEVISPLLSRSRVFVLNHLEEKDLEKIISNALANLNGLNNKFAITQENKSLIAQLANGDARSALNILELASHLSKEKEISTQSILDASQRTFLRYDKTGEEHYNIISALHKSLRDSDQDAAVYWTMRMIEAGEDPKYIIRRMIRFASEDIGNADPQALQLATAAKDAVEFLGYPECDTALVQTAIYLANAPKSNIAYTATLKARADIRETGNLPVPLHLRNAPTALMKDLGYGKGYKYAHNFPGAKVEQEHLPEKLKGRKYIEER
ncbi:replication-associated recombination protein A [Candidatus Pacearchaeota archaeon]|nr:replication-associated recombination protein A [Candidatus Pacearchaeota archaeon]